MTFSDRPLFVLTEHAEQAIAKRKIPLEWIERVLTTPQRTEPDRNDPQLRHALGRVPEHEGRVLRVVYNETTVPWRIVTIYFDRNQRKRL